MKKVEETKAASATVQAIKPRRKFDSAFKREAVALWLNSGKSARRFGGKGGITVAIYPVSAEWRVAGGPRVEARATGRMWRLFTRTSSYGLWQEGDSPLV